MGNKAQRIEDEIRLQMGASVYETVIHAAGVLKPAHSPARQKRFVRDALTELIALREQQCAEQVMRACGRQCISNTALLAAGGLYREAEGNLDRFLDGLNARHIGGGRLRREGALMIAEYEACYCSIAQKNKGLPEQYCACPEGWFEKLFSYALEEVGSVRRINTILAGGTCCLFEIQI